MKSVVDYTFNDTSIANPDSSLPATISGAQIGVGPGNTAFGHFDKALELGQSGKGVVDISGIKLDFAEFFVRMLFKVETPVIGRRVLVESDALPFRLFVDKGTTAANFTVHGQVQPDGLDWAGATSGFAKDLQPNTWYTATLAYDDDTVGLFVDEELVAVHAFPQGVLKSIGGSHLHIGVGAGGQDHFGGAIAWLQWKNGPPKGLLTLLDERRSTAEWFITYKYESLRGVLPLGEAIGPLAVDPFVQANTQQYVGGAIQYHDGVGAAFEMHGAIHRSYLGVADKAELGYLVSDEGDTAKMGGRKSIFSKGAIYWSPATRAVPVFGQLYIAYEAMGESGTVLGFPTDVRRPVAGGAEQAFEGGRMYERAGGASAHEVHGAILARYLARGGVTTFGFPITDELDLKRGGTSIGRTSEFEGCTFYWSPATGAYEVHGDIRRKFRDELGGPAGILGFPTSDESDVPGVPAPARFNSFQQGSILWFGSWSSTTVVTAFSVFVGRIDSKESEGFLMGQNDIYTRITLRDGSNTVYEQRQPPSGDWSGRNIVDLNLNIPAVIVPNNPAMVATLIVDVWESDDGAPFGGGDDHLGTWTKALTVANAWGFAENDGILNSGSFSDINNITASVKPKVDVAALSESQKFWGVRNRGTPTISWEQYASAFSDVDSDTEWWDLTDWLEKAFYELVVDSLAGNGNCFGMSLEAIKARKGVSLFGLPLDRFTNWSEVSNEFNIKHCYQVGAGPIWWFLDQFISGNTHDPRDVFDRTWQEASRGNNPVLCIAQNYDFSGAPHCILPVGWDKSSKPWRITICDPNFPGQLKELTVNPDNNTFNYVGASSYSGGEWSGGRMHYMPYTLLSSPPRTPIWDAIQLILDTTVVIVGDGARTNSITDLRGNDLDAFGARATQRLKADQRLDGFFVGFKGYDRAVIRDDRLVDQPDVSDVHAFDPELNRSIAGEFLARRFAASTEAVTDSRISDAVIAHTSIADLIRDRRFRPLADAIVSHPSIPGMLDRTIVHVASDPETMHSLDPDARDLIKRLVSASGTNDYRHAIEATSQGNLTYTVKRGFSEINLQAPLDAGATTEIETRNPGTSKQSIAVKASADTSLTVLMQHKLGVGRNRLGLTVSGIPLDASASVEINARPGLGGADIVAAGQSASATVSVDAQVDGRSFKGQYDVPIDGGVRLRPASVLTEGTLNVSRIDALFGPPASKQKIRRRR